MTKKQKAFKAMQARKSAAAYQQELRRKRDAKKQCRICGAPAGVSKKTRRIAKLCPKHLAVDKRRKVERALPWEGDAPDLELLVDRKQYRLDWDR